MNSMRRISAWLMAKCRDRKGVTLIEYSLLLVLIAFIVWLIVESIGGTTYNKISAVNSRFSK